MTATWIAKALDSEVWNIGQLDRTTVAALERLVRAGQLVKSREHWCNLAPLKTVWRAA